MGQIEEILHFWFGEPGSLKDQISRQSALWWGKSEQLDAEIGQRFGTVLETLINRGLESWKNSAEGWLSMIIVADQFSRNIFRDDARAFEQDEQALSLCLEGLERGIDVHLNPLQRVFFYLPLEHSESLSMQKRCLDEMARLVELAPIECKKEFEGFLAYARAHYEVIEKYGRFPHRNAVLGRESTVEEKAYLSEPNAGF